MNTTITFVGDKLVVRQMPTRAQTLRSLKIVSRAVRGELKFAWRRVPPTRKRHYTPKRLAHLLDKDHRQLEGRDYDDVVRHKRAERWNSRNVHSLIPTDDVIKLWKSNCQKVKNACAVLKQARFLSYYHVSGTGRMEICYERSGNSLRIHDQAGRSITLPVKYKVPRNERLARLKGKLHKMTPESYQFALSQERKRKIRELQESIPKLWGFGIGTLFKSQKQFGENYWMGMPTIPDTGIPNVPPVFYIQQPDEHERLRGMRMTSGVPTKMKDIDYEHMVMAANERLEDLYGTNNWIKERELKIFGIRLIDIYRMQLGIRKPEREEVIRHKSADGIYVNL